jgi:protochlorophyllide reductase
MKEAEDPRLIMVGSVTGNDNTVGGGGVYPIADLKDLEGLKNGGKAPIAMIDGFNFNGAKAYKDTKMCLMMTSNTLHDRFVSPSLCSTCTCGLFILIFVA